MMPLNKLDKTNKTISYFDCVFFLRYTTIYYENKSVKKVYKITSASSFVQVEMHWLGEYLQNCVGMFKLR